MGEGAKWTERWKKLVRVQERMKATGPVRSGYHAFLRCLAQAVGSVLCEGLLLSLEVDLDVDVEVARVLGVALHGELALDALAGVHDQRLAGGKDTRTHTYTRELAAFRDQTADVLSGGTAQCPPSFVCLT